MIPDVDEFHSIFSSGYRGKGVREHINRELAANEEGKNTYPMVRPIDKKLTYVGSLPVLHKAKNLTAPQRPPVSAVAPDLFHALGGGKNIALSTGIRLTRMDEPQIIEENKNADDDNSEDNQSVYKNDLQDAIEQDYLNTNQRLPWAPKGSALADPSTWIAVQEFNEGPVNATVVQQVWQKKARRFELMQNGSLKTRDELFVDVDSLDWDLDRLKTCEALKKKRSKEIDGDKEIYHVLRTEEFGTLGKSHDCRMRSRSLKSLHQFSSLKNEPQTTMGMSSTEYMQYEPILRPSAVDSTSPQQLLEFTYPPTLTGQRLVDSKSPARLATNSNYGTTIQPVTPTRSHNNYTLKQSSVEMRSSPGVRAATLAAQRTHTRLVLPEHCIYIRTGLCACVSCRALEQAKNDSPHHDLIVPQIGLDEAATLSAALRSSDTPLLRHVSFANCSAMGEKGIELVLRALVLCPKQPLREVTKLDFTNCNLSSNVLINWLVECFHGDHMPNLKSLVLSENPKLFSLKQTTKAFSVMLSEIEHRFTDFSLELSNSPLPPNSNAWTDLCSLISTPSVVQHLDLTGQPLSAASAQSLRSAFQSSSSLKSLSIGGFCHVVLQECNELLTKKGDSSVTVKTSMGFTPTSPNQSPPGTWRNNIPTLQLPPLTNGSPIHKASHSQSAAVLFSNLPQSIQTLCVSNAFLDSASIRLLVDTLQSNNCHDVHLNVSKNPLGVWGTRALLELVRTGCCTELMAAYCEPAGEVPSVGGFQLTSNGSTFFQNTNHALANVVQSVEELRKILDCLTTRIDFVLSEGCSWKKLLQPYVIQTKLDVFEDLSDTAIDNFPLEVFDLVQFAADIDVVTILQNIIDAMKSTTSVPMVVTDMQKDAGKSSKSKPVDPKPSTKNSKPILDEKSTLPVPRVQVNVCLLSTDVSQSDELNYLKFENISQCSAATYFGAATSQLTPLQAITSFSTLDQWPLAPVQVELDLKNSTERLAFVEFLTKLETMDASRLPTHFEMAKARLLRDIAQLKAEDVAKTKQQLQTQGKQTKGKGKKEKNIDNLVFSPATFIVKTIKEKLFAAAQLIVPRAPVEWYTTGPKPLHEYCRDVKINQRPIRLSSPYGKSVPENGTLTFQLRLPSSFDADMELPAEPRASLTIERSQQRESQWRSLYELYHSHPQSSNVLRYLQQKKNFCAEEISPGEMCNSCREKFHIIINALKHISSPKAYNVVIHALFDEYTLSDAQVSAIIDHTPKTLTSLIKSLQMEQSTVAEFWNVKELVPTIESP